MNKYILLLGVFLIFGCKEKNENNSKYKDQISDLKTDLKAVDSVFSVFDQYSVDSLVKLSKQADAKYKKVKTVYQSDSIDTNYESIMLTVRGKFVKGLKNVVPITKQIKEEYSYTKKQVSVLNNNLIHEILDHDSAMIYYNQEKLAMLELNARIRDYITNSEYCKNNYPIYSAKMDSILSIFEEKK